MIRTTGASMDGRVRPGARRPRTSPYRPSEDQARQILATVPGAARLCAAFDRSLHELAERTRRRRIALLTSAGSLLGCIALLLHGGPLTDLDGISALCTIGGLLLAAVAAVDGLRLHERRMVRTRQGARLLRAMQIAGAPEELRARIRSDANATATFLLCHRLWSAS